MAARDQLPPSSTVYRVSNDEGFRVADETFSAEQGSSLGVSDSDDSFSLRFHVLTVRHLK